MDWKELYRNNVFPTPVAICNKCNEFLVIRIDSPNDVEEMMKGLEVTDNDYFDEINKLFNKVDVETLEMIDACIEEEIKKLNDEL
jgi:hypothetical protein